MARGFGVGWRQVAACIPIAAAGAALSSGYGVIAVPLGAEFQPSRMVLMLAVTIMSLVAALLSPMLGALLDKRSLRLMMGAGVASIVLGYIALSFVTTFTQALIVYGVFMAPANILATPMATNVLLARWFVNRRGTAIGIAISGMALGGFVYPPVTQLLLDHYHWREALRLLAVVIGVVTFPAVFMVVNRPSDRGLFPDGADSPPPAAMVGDGAAPFSIGVLLGDRAFWTLAFICGVVMSGMLGMVVNLVALATDQGIAAASAALLISCYAAGGFAAKLGFAAIADRIDPRFIMLGSLVGFAAGMACLVWAEAGYAMIAAGATLVGIAGGGIAPMQGFLIPRIFGQHVVGRVSGILNMLILVTLLTTPPMFGLIFDIYHSYDAIFLTFVVLALVAATLVPSLRMRPKEPIAGDPLKPSAQSV